MNHDTPLSPLPLHHLADGSCPVLTTQELRAHGVPPAEVADRCRPGGPWQQLLPGVHLLHQGPPTSQERLHAALRYARHRGPSVPVQPRAPEAVRDPMITGLAALALHGFAAAPPLLSLERIEVLVARSRRLRSAGFARIVRGADLPAPQQVTGVPTAPVPRALADAVAGLADGAVVRRLLTEAVRGGHCEAAAVVRELTRARLLARPHVVDAVDALLAEGRALAEQRLYDAVRAHGLPDPVWNVDLRLPGGPYLGGVDAYWPEYAVAVEIDTRPARPAAGEPAEPAEDEHRDALERLGITVVRCRPRTLREAPEQQATVIRTALMAAAGREPAAYVAVLPR
ncbi:endonuclease domain-containing protein [Streptomyces sp. RS10V-4]|uniref:endonuclease domain-containing protein n=1 Tax=Streptomyces rhizoryzae TaxID=2932493 RepID=UPI002003B566|nr:endonuclease domain-containing protein [Streptomyces rhizoryzae]MCK7626790.1 endonuclease domain-containing protein [Streptomyces rhizoryzae]